MPTPTADVHIECFESIAGNWRQKQIPQWHAANFELLERGGMGDGSLELQVPWNEVDLDGSEFVDIYLFGTLIYRGWIRTANRLLDAPESASLSLQSAVDILNHTQVRWKLAYGGDGADLATIAGDLVTDFAVPITRFGSYVTQDMDATGITLKQFDGRGQSVAAALSKLCDHAAGNAIWGIEATWDASAPPAPVHRLYFRPKPTSTSKFYSVGKDVTAFAYPKDSLSIINVVNLTGGPVKQPNLAYNPSFEEIEPASETVGNLLLDPSFEDNDAAWTLTGTRKFTGMDGTARGTPKSGKYWLELDQNTESGIQVVLASYQATYVGWCWIRREDSGTATQVKLTIEGLDVTNTVIVSSATAYTAPAGTNWEKLTTPDLDCSGQPTVVKIRFRVETNGGSASNDGVLVDDCALVIKDSEGAVGWRRIVAGVANASTFQWNYKPAAGAFHGGYVVRSDPSAIAAGTDYIEIRTTKDKRIEVQPNERYSFLVWFNVVNPVDVSIGIIEYDANGSNLATNVSATSTLTIVGWQTVQFVLTGSSDGPGLTMNANTRSVELFVRHLDNDEVLIDALFFCAGDFPDDLDIGVLSSGEYWTGEVYERRFKTSDALFTGGLALSAAADSSIADYGERETDESNDLVIDYDSATQWAQDYFNSHAVPAYLARLGVSNLSAAAELLLTTDGKVQILNLNDAPDALSPSRISYGVRNDVISMDADLGSELPTFEELFRISQGREKGRAF